MELQLGIKVLLKNSDNKYLLVRRSLEKYPETRGEEWDIVGGRITPGTSLEENLQREVFEEVGLSLTGKPRLLVAQDILHIPEYLERHVVRLTYVGSIQGEPVLDDEASEFGWFTLEQIRTMGNLNFYLKQLFID